MTDETKQLVSQAQELATADDLYGAPDQQERFFEVVSAVAPWAKGKYPMGQREIILVVRKAMAMGLDPLNPHEVQIWKDQRGDVNFQLAYTLMREWVAHYHGRHTEPRYKRLRGDELLLEGLDDDDVAYRVTFIMLNDLDRIKELIDKAGYTAALAREMLEVTGIGVATASEYHGDYFAPKGRTRSWKVKKRALIDAYRKRFGTPTRSEIIQLRRIRGDNNLTLEDWEEAATVSNPEEQIELARRNAKLRKLGSGSKDESPEEILEKHRELLHGSEEDREGFESEATDEDEPDQPSPEPDDILDGEYSEVDEDDSFAALKDKPEVYEAARFETNKGAVLGYESKKKLMNMLDYFLSLEDPGQRAIEMQEHVEYLVEYLNEEGPGTSVFDTLDSWQPPTSEDVLDANRIIAEIRKASGWQEVDGGGFNRPEGDFVEGDKMKLTAAVIGNAVGGDKEMRHNLLQILVTESTTKKVLEAEADAILARWQREDSWESNKQAKEEARTILFANGLFNTEVFSDTM